jgi:hypothetical protein
MIRRDPVGWVVTDDVGRIRGGIDEYEHIAWRHAWEQHIRLFGSNYSLDEWLNRMKRAGWMARRVWLQADIGDKPAVQA